MSQESKGMQTFQKIDDGIRKVTKILSWASPICLLIMTFLATGNVLTSKIFTMPIPGSVNAITYLLVPVVYFAVAHELLYRGFTYVDLFTDKFPTIVNIVIQVISAILGVIVFGLISYYNIAKFQDALAYKTLSEAGSGGFVLWPFYLIIVVMCAVLAIAFAWTVVRVIVYKGKVPYVTGADMLPPPEEIKPVEEKEEE